MQQHNPVVFFGQLFDRVEVSQSKLRLVNTHWHLTYIVEISAENVTVIYQNAYLAITTQSTFALANLRAALACTKIQWPAGAARWVRNRARLRAHDLPIGAALAAGALWAVCGEKIRLLAAIGTRWRIVADIRQ